MADGDKSIASVGALKECYTKLNGMESSNRDQYINTVIKYLSGSNNIDKTTLDLFKDYNKRANGVSLRGKIKVKTLYNYLDTISMTQLICGIGPVVAEVQSTKYSRKNTEPFMNYSCTLNSNGDNEYIIPINLSPSGIYSNIIQYQVAPYGPNTIYTYLTMDSLTYANTRFSLRYGDWGLCSSMSRSDLRKIKNFELNEPDTEYKTVVLFMSKFYRENLIDVITKGGEYFERIEIIPKTTSQGPSGGPDIPLINLGTSDPSGQGIPMTMGLPTPPRIEDVNE